MLQGPIFLKLMLMLNTAGVSRPLRVMVSGFLGEQVVLPCTYKGNASLPDLQVTWIGPGLLIIREFVQGRDVTIDHGYRNRTQLFLDELARGNWSVKMSGLQESDQGTHKCLIEKKDGAGYIAEQVTDIILNVTERAPSPIPSTPAPDPGLPTGAAVGLGIGILALILAAIGVFLIRKRLWKQNQDSSNPEAASNGGPLTNVRCSGEARGLLPTAAEHQTGAAGDQILLGNPAVQH